MTKNYQQYINEIEGFKNKISEGVTSNCKKLIDECYSEGVEKRVTELELYDRKAALFNDKNYIANSYYDYVMMIVSAFVGTVIAHGMDKVQLIMTEIVEKKMFLEQNPMKILYGKPDLNWWAIIISVLIFFVGVCIYKKNDDKRNGENMFRIDMCEYELKKIGEILNKL